MPTYLDRHKLPSVSAEEVAHAHALDLATQDKYGVKFLTYWFDARCCHAFCLVEAPDAETANRVHKEAHGLEFQEIMEVDPSLVEIFLGRIVDPPAVAAGKEPISESARRVVMFTDIVDSVGMTERLGDARAADLVRAHDSVVRRALEEHGGREVKHLGDGIMASFADTPGAVGCACTILRNIETFNDKAEDRLFLRIGMHAGEPVQQNNDLFGATVQLASRICADAAIDAIVISEDVRQDLGDAFQLTPLGRRMLKGFREPAPLFAVEWRAA